MNDKINNELIKIQDELIALESAAKQIEKAELVAKEVISSIKELQGKYTNHLDFVQKQIHQLMDQTGSQTEQLVNDLMQKHTNQLESISKIFEEFHNKTVQTQEQNYELVKNSFNKTDSQIQELASSHQKQIEEISQLLKNYSELIKSSEILTEAINRIDFPKRLGNLENAAIQLNQVQVQLKTDFQEIETSNTAILSQTKRINRKSTLQLIFIILIFIGILGISLDVINNHFPRLFDFLR
jgi:hypothetical protein